MQVAKQMQVVHSSTGIAMTVVKKNQTPLGNKVQAFVNADTFVDEDTMQECILEHLATEKCMKEGWILDSFPRTQAQVNLMNQKGFKPICVFILGGETEEEEPSYTEMKNILKANYKTIDLGGSNDEKLKSIIDFKF